MLPLSDDRRLISDFVDNYLLMMQFYKDRYQLIAHPILDTFYVNG